MTVIQKKHDNPIAHLTPEDIETARHRARRDPPGRDRLPRRGRRGVHPQGHQDPAQPRAGQPRRAAVRVFPPAWLVGTAGLSVAKILDNMEIGHNILHGQWDWMRDPKIHSTTWEWDNASPAEQWKHSHNELHHTYTNVVGKDNDLGYGIMRVDEDQRGHPFYLVQPVWNFINAMFFEYGIAAYDLELGAVVKKKQTKEPEFKRRAKQVVEQDPQPGHQGLRRAPGAVGPDRSFLPTLAANFTANVVRNLWANSVIMCGHFPEGVETFEKRSIEGETHGEWYVRQMLGSANISGSQAMHLMTGNLSHQIEHHLFPDLPSNRYAEIAPQVQALFEKYGLSYCARPLPQQVYSAWHKVVRLSLPNGWLATTNAKNLPSQLGIAVGDVDQGPQGRRAAQARLTQPPSARRRASGWRRGLIPAGPGQGGGAVDPRTTRDSGSSTDRAARSGSSIASSSIRAASAPIW